MGRLSTFREIMRPWNSRLLVAIPAAAGAYQFGCDQFNLPKLPALWRMTGWQFPWWGWLLIAQAGFIYALFEYVRRSIPSASAAGAPANPDAAASAQQYAELKGKVDQMVLGIMALKTSLQAFTRRYRYTADCLISARIGASLAEDAEQFQRFTEEYVESARTGGHKHALLTMTYDRSRDRVRELLPILGVDPKVMDASVVQEQEKIRGDVIYQESLAEGEKGGWASNAARRDWLLNKAAADALSEAYLKAVQQQTQKGRIDLHMLKELNRLRLAEEANHAI